MKVVTTPCTKLTFDLIPDFLRSEDLSDWILTLQSEDSTCIQTRVITMAKDQFACVVNYGSG